MPNITSEIKKALLNLIEDEGSIPFTRSIFFILFEFKI